MSRRLDSHLYPKGRSASQPNLIPNVLDSDGTTIDYTSNRRITSETTVVDIGDSPNSNTGDPLRTAFVKINNFIEASYWTNQEIDEDMADLEEYGPFLGVLLYSDLTDATRLSRVKNGYVAVLNEKLEANTINAWNTAYSKIDPAGFVDNQGEYVLKKGSVLQWNSTSEKYDVLYNNEAQDVNFDYSKSLGRFSSGNAETTDSSSDQTTLATDYINSEQVEINSQNIEDALMETIMRLTGRGTDTGYYG